MLSNQCFVVVFKIYLFIYSERAKREAEKQAPCRKPDVGLDLGSPGSHPGLQVALNRCATGAALKIIILNISLKSRNRMKVLASKLPSTMEWKEC